MMFKLTVYFKHEMIGIWPRVHRNFELTMFELTMPNLYMFLFTKQSNNTDKALCHKY